MGPHQETPGATALQGRGEEEEKKRKKGRKKKKKDCSLATCWLGL